MVKLLPHIFYSVTSLVAVFQKSFHSTFDLNTDTLLTIYILSFSLSPPSKFVMTSWHKLRQCPAMSFPVHHIKSSLNSQSRINNTCSLYSVVKIYHTNNSVKWNWFILSYKVSLASEEQTRQVLGIRHCAHMLHTLYLFY
jgi:hypothetical protein